MSEDSHGRLAVFQTDTSITLTFRDRVYVIAADEPFFNIAKKCLEIDDMIPFYVEIAKREGMGETFRDRLLEEVERLKQEQEDH